MTLISSSLLIHMIELLSLVLFFTTATQVMCRLSNETDRLALLSFKELIAEDPLGSSSSWNNSLDLCKWDGVTCSRKHRRIVVLDLRGKSLSGILSPFLGNLSFLRSLYLQNNIFQGKIPMELGLLFRLQHLNLSFNSLQGEIPTNLSNYLTAIDFKSNNLVGKIPASFGSLSKLTYLNLCTNNLIGGIPPSLGNLSLLRIVDLGVNSITGTIPYSIGLLPNLRAFSIGVNKLSEYGVGGKISTQGDVYSYGILLLEMMTGRRPTDEIFTDRQSLHEFCKSALPE
ncbi:LRR receptor-like serine/threonine-protein kinase EFR [Rhododendron vialii]|uniref:LRR receptor-like serine/threonine-protein kinase EFR n=1 Tax=Rhododendron vialii TaxID=182163 RepID=UPI00265E7B25|nr:LRR receptor-like serine/threonine-protein kinase EFR [Rhododendron vialii]